MPTLSRGLKKYENQLKNAERILIPYSSVTAKYPTLVAEMIRQHEMSESVAAKEHKLSEPVFKWCLDYVVPSDPSTDNEETFIRKMQESTEVFLVCWGLRFKGCIPIPTDDDNFPIQIRNRYMERAKYICSKPRNIPLIIGTAIASPPDTNFKRDLNSIHSSINALGGVYNLNRQQRDMVNIINICLYTIKNVQPVDSPTGNAYSSSLSIKNSGTVEVAE